MKRQRGGDYCDLCDCAACCGHTARVCAVARHEAHTGRGAAAGAEVEFLRHAYRAHVTARGHEELLIW